MVRHSKDRLFITKTEWQRDYGGAKGAVNHGYQVLPFGHCALSLAPYTHPVCTPAGILFNKECLEKFIKKYECDPCTGEEMKMEDIIILKMVQDEDGKWYCPVTCRIFNDNSHVVAIKNTGNVYLYDAVSELNIKQKKMTDLITGESFAKEDIITLNNPKDTEFMAKRDVSNFLHLKAIREENIVNIDNGSNSKINHNHNLNTTTILKELEKKNEKLSEKDLEIRNKIFGSIKYDAVSDPNNQDIKEFLMLEPTIEDVDEGRSDTTGVTTQSFTSSSMNVSTGSHIRLATPDDIREARFKILKYMKKKCFVQLQTSQGNLNVEVASDITPRTAWNFITLCKNGYYVNTIFHRLIPGFMVQGGDPAGTGTGGTSAFPLGMAFNDEFDSRLRHNSRGIVSMANSGKNTNLSQFFITFKECSHLDNKHTVFGRLVGGLATLQSIEELGSDSANRPYTEIKILKTEVFNDPMSECDELLRNKILNSKEKRKKSTIVTAVPLSKDKIAATNSSVGTSNDNSKNEAIAKFLQSHSQNNIINSNDEHKQKRFKSGTQFSTF